MGRKFAMTDRCSEQAIQRAVVAHLTTRAVPGLFWWHHPAGGRRSAIEAAIFKGLGTKAGIPDLLFVKDGRLFGLELKTANGKLSLEQQQTQWLLFQAGCCVETTYSLDQALGCLESWQLLRPNRAVAA